MNAITLLDRFTYVAPAAGGSLNTPWVSFPSVHKSAELWVDAKTLEQGQIDVKLQSSIDTSQEEDAATVNVTAAGNSITPVTSELGPLVRLNVSSTAAAAAGTISVWVVPKDN